MSINSKHFSMTIKVFIKLLQNKNKNLFTVIIYKILIFLMTKNWIVIKMLFRLGFLIHKSTFRITWLKLTICLKKVFIFKRWHDTVRQFDHVTSPNLPK